MTYKEIQERMRSKGLTQREFAKIAHVAEPTVSHFLRRKFKSKRLSLILDRCLGTDRAIR